MARRDPQRTQKLRIAVRYLLERECLAKGNQTRLAEHFKVSRQRVHQIVVEERRRDMYAGRALPPVRSVASVLDAGVAFTPRAHGA